MTVSDGNGQTNSCDFDVVVEDNQDPSVTSLPLITGECSATVPVPSVTDNCAGTVVGTTTDPLTYNTQGSFVVNWTFDDGNGNVVVIPQSVVVNDTTDPVAVCQDITLVLDGTTGLATITPAQINNGSSDNCGTVNLSLSQTVFDCTNIGSNVVVLTVDDGNGNSETCTAIVTITDPNISGGSLTAYLVGTETPADADDLVEVTACPFDTTTDPPTPAIQSAMFTLTGYTGVITSWESSTDGGLNWTTINNTTDTYTFNNITQTTLVRAVIQFGACQANSSIVRVVVIPPDVPPTIIGPDEFIICLGESFTVVAESSFGVPPILNQGGQFNQGNLPGWEVDGLDGVTNWNASGSNSVPTGWRGISNGNGNNASNITCLLYTSPSPRDKRQSRMPSSA